MSDTIHPIDAHVGASVRMRRKALGFSQGQLAEALGLTFQQIQKYECGTNRISASKLYETAQSLNVTVDYFFNGLAPLGEAEVAESEVSVSHFLLTSEGVAMAKSFPKLSPAKRRSIIAVVRAVLSDEERRDDRFAPDAATVPD